MSSVATGKAGRIKHVTPKEERVPLLTKIAFGIGTAAESIVTVVIGGSALFFYNQVLGMSATMASLALTASLILDGLADPVVGSLSDRTRGKLGRRHPYMLLAPFVSCASLALVFNPPESLTSLISTQHGPAEWWLFLWFFSFIVSLRVSMAFFHVPHLALGGELSKDYVERTRVMSFSSFFGWVGGAPMRFLALSIFFVATPQHPNGLYNPEVYGPYGIIAAVVAFACLMVSGLFTLDQVKRLPQPALSVGKFSPFAFFGDVGKAFRNMNYTWLLIAYFFLSLTTGLRQALDLYVNTHYWHLTPEELRWLIIGSFVGFVLAFFVVPRLHGRFDKKPTILVTAVCYACVPALPVVLHWAGLFPDPGTRVWDSASLAGSVPGWLVAPLTQLNDGALLGLIFTMAFSSGLTAILLISVMSTLADIADENELRFGVRQEGVLYSTRTLFGKIDAAIGTFAAGLALDFIAFPERALPGSVDPAIVHNLAMVESPIAAVPALIAVIFYAQLKITTASYAKTRADLEAKQKAEAEATASTGPEPQPGAGGG